jgi:hypothetical protein
MTGKDAIGRFVGMEQIPSVEIAPGLASARKTVQLSISCDLARGFNALRLHCFPELFDDHGRWTPIAGAGNRFRLSIAFRILLNNHDRLRANLSTGRDRLLAAYLRTIF